RTDVYGGRMPLPSERKPIVLGQVTQRSGRAKKGDEDPFYGMSADDKEPVGPQTDKNGKTSNKNDPMMPVAWTKSYQLPGGKPGRSFTTTMGSSTDLTNEAFRRLLVNAVYDLLGMKVPDKADVELVGEYKPSAYGFGGQKKGVRP